MHSHPILHWTWRGAVTLVGGVILLAGIIMCITPGPGFAGIILGLGVLATEYAWARGLLRYAQRWLHHAKASALEAQHTRRKRKARRLRGEQPESH